MSRKLCGPAVVLILALSQISYALAAGVSKEDYDFFKAETYSQYGGELDPSDIEDQFYAIASTVEYPSQATKAFAKELDVPLETAQEYAAALIEAVRFREQCKANRDSESCSFEPGAPLYDALLESGLDDESGRLAVSIGKAIPKYTDAQRSALSTYIGVIFEHPARASILSRLYDYGREISYAAALAATEPANVESAILFRTESQSFSACEAGQYGSFLALLEMARNKAAADVNERESYLLFTESIIWAKLRFGLSSEAVQSFNHLSEDLRDHLAAAPPGVVDGTERQRFIRENANFLLDVAYAMYSQRDSQGAQELLQDREAVLKGHRVEGRSDAASAAALKEAMTRRLSENDLYDMYVYGRLESDPAPSSDEEADRYDNDGRWLFAMRKRPVVARVEIAQRLREAGYESMAGYLSNDIFRSCRDNRDPLTAIRQLLPDEFAEFQDRWTKQIKEAWQSPASVEESLQGDELTVVYRGANPLVVEEFELPSDYVRPEAQQSDDEEHNEFSDKSLVPEGIYVPVEPSSVVRYADENGERHIIFLSSAIDRPGEIPAFGYWFQSTFNGGRNWGAPLYLGLQQFFPYVVVSDSNFPLLVDGKLRIEVEVKEIDPASITFPPIALAFKRQARDRYISIDMDDLRRDYDDDYMTDVVEYRLGLNPTNRDTDGDDIPDGIDSLPLTAFDSDATQESIELAFAILETIHGYERAALMVEPSSKASDENVLTGLELTSSRRSDASSLFLVADPKIFSGIRIEERLLVYTEDDIELISGGQAPFYPARVSHLFRKKSGEEYYVIWSASWTGGEFIVKCREDQCTVEVTSSWIT